MTPDIIAALSAQDFEQHPIGKALIDLRHRGNANFSDPQHQGQRGCDWDAGLLAAYEVVRAALSTSPTGQEVREVSLVQARRIVDAVTAYCRGADFSCDMKAATKAIRLMLNGLASPSVEPAGNGREVGTELGTQVGTPPAATLPDCIVNGDVEAWLFSHPDRDGDMEAGRLELFNFRMGYAAPPPSQDQKGVEERG